MSDDPGQQYFSDGITEDIITELSRFHSLFVRSSSSTFGHRGVGDVTRLGRDLGVGYVVEGSVRKLRDRIRITTQLVDAKSGDHLWAERFDHDQQDIFAVQDEVVGTIVGTLVGRLQAAGAERVRRKPPASLAAYECVLRGSALAIGDPDAEAEARALYEKAIALDPDYARAHALLAYLLSIRWFCDLSGSDAALDRALDLAKRAVALDDNDSICHDHLGWIYLNRKSFDLAEHHKQRALELTPNCPEQVACMGVLQTFLGNPEEAIAWFAQARRLDPYFDPAWYWRMQAIAHFIARRYDEAISGFSRSSTTPVWVDAYLAACHALTDEADRARAFAAEVLRREPGFSAARLALKEPYRRQADRDHLLAGMRKAGLPD